MVIEIKMKGDTARMSAYYLARRLTGRKRSTTDDRKTARYLARAIKLMVAQIVYEEATKDAEAARLRRQG